MQKYENIGKINEYYNNAQGGEGIPMLVYDKEEKPTPTIPKPTKEVWLKWAQNTVKPNNWVYAPALNKNRHILVYRNLRTVNRNYRGWKQQAILLANLQPEDLEQDEYILGPIWREVCRGELVDIVIVTRKDKHLEEINSTRKEVKLNYD